MSCAVSSRFKIRQSILFALQVPSLVRVGVVVDACSPKHKWLTSTASDFKVSDFRTIHAWFVVAAHVSPDFQATMHSDRKRRWTHNTYSISDVDCACACACYLHRTPANRGCATPVATRTYLDTDDGRPWGGVGAFFVSLLAQPPLSFSDLTKEQPDIRIPDSHQAGGTAGIEDAPPSPLSLDLSISPVPEVSVSRAPGLGPREREMRSDKLLQFAHLNPVAIFKKKPQSELKGMKHKHLVDLVLELQTELETCERQAHEHSLVSRKQQSCLFRTCCCCGFEYWRGRFVEWVFGISEGIVCLYMYTAEDSVDMAPHPLDEGHVPMYIIDCIRFVMIPPCSI